jgi:hypothetical protein
MDLIKNSQYFSINYLLFSMVSVHSVLPLTCFEQ